MTSERALVSVSSVEYSRATVDSGSLRVRKNAGTLPWNNAGNMKSTGSRYLRRKYSQLGIASTWLWTHLRPNSNPRQRASHESSKSQLLAGLLLRQLIISRTEREYAKNGARYTSRVVIGAGTLWTHSSVPKLAAVPPAAVDDAVIMYTENRLDR